MTIDGVASYEEIYSEHLTDEDIKRFNRFGVEWRGRNILDIRDDFCIKAIGVFALIYAQKAFTNPKELPQLKAEIVQIFEDLFDSEVEDEDEPSPLLYRYDPISGTYRELIGAEAKYLKKTCKKVGKGFKKAKKAVTKGVRETGRWAREHPVETAVIVVGVVVGGAGVVAAVGGAVEGAARSGDNHNKDKSTTSRTPANSSSEINAPPSISAEAPSKFIPPSPTDQPFVLPNQFIPYNQVFMPPPEYDISKPPICRAPTGGSNIKYPGPNNFSSGYIPHRSLGSGNIAKSIPETRPAGVEFTTPNASIVPDKQQNAPVNLTDSSSDKSFAERTREIVSGPVHEGWKCIGILGKNTLQLVEDLNPSIAKGLQERKTLREAWEEEAVPFVHEKIDKLFSTNVKDDFDPKKDGAVDQALQNFFLNPLIGLGGVASTESVVSHGAKVDTAGNIFGNAGKVFANEAFAVEKTIQAGLNTSLIGKELGFTTREMAQLKQAGKLEGTIAHAYENVVKVPAIRESFEIFEKAQNFLKSYKGVMPETRCRELIHQTGIRTFSRPVGIPENYLVKITNKGAGMEYVHPTNTHIRVRVMPGKPHSSNPCQQKPYVIQKIDGGALDKAGKCVTTDSPAAHIPLEEFIYRSHIDGN